MKWACLPRSSTCGFPSGPASLVEQIFASHLEDWPALLKSLHGVGDEVRARAKAAQAEQKASLQ